MQTSSFETLFLQKMSLIFINSYTRHYKSFRNKIIGEIKLLIKNLHSDECALPYITSGVIKTIDIAQIMKQLNLNRDE